MKRTRAGEWFLVLGFFHTVVGVLLGTGLLAGLARVLGVDLGPHARGALFGMGEVGLVGAAMPGHAAEFGLFWFFVGGFFLAALGALLRWLHRAHRIVVPSFLLWTLGAIAVLGIVMMPISGFWLLLVLSVGLLADRTPTMVVAAA